MSTEYNKNLVYRFLDDVWAKGNLDAADEIIAEDHVHHLSRSDLHGPESVKKLVLWLRDFLPNLHTTSG